LPAALPSSSAAPPSAARRARLSILWLQHQSRPISVAVRTSARQALREPGLGVAVDRARTLQAVLQQCGEEGGYAAIRGATSPLAVGGQQDECDAASGATTPADSAGRRSGNVLARPRGETRGQLELRVQAQPSLSPVLDAATAAVRSGTHLLVCNARLLGAGWLDSGSSMFDVAPIPLPLPHVGQAASGAPVQVAGAPLPAEQVAGFRPGATVTVATAPAAAATAVAPGPLSLIRLPDTAAALRAERLTDLAHRCDAVLQAMRQQLAAAAYDSNGTAGRARAQHAAAPPAAAILFDRRLPQLVHRLLVVQVAAAADPGGGTAGSAARTAPVLQHLLASCAEPEPGATAACVRPAVVVHLTVVLRGGPPGGGPLHVAEGAPAGDSGPGDTRGLVTVPAPTNARVSFATAELPALAGHDGGPPSISAVDVMTMLRRQVQATRAEVVVLLVPRPLARQPLRSNAGLERPQPVAAGRAAQASPLQQSPTPLVESEPQSRGHAIPAALQPSPVAPMIVAASLSLGLSVVALLSPGG
jgi:hypothetical protein